MKSWHFIAAFSLLLCLHLTAGGAVAWDESVDGDLSGDPKAPTVVAFSGGSNIVDGTMVASTDAFDYMTFTIEPGQQLTRLSLLEFVDLPSGQQGNTAFHAIIAGATSFIPAFSNVNNFMGSNHLDFIHIGIDLLADLAGAPFGGTGFTIPLGPGTYTYHVQQVDEQLTGYTLDFVVEGESGPDSADFDGDGDVDGQDFLAWQRGGSPNALSAADLALWQEQYGMGSLVAPVSVPEPTTLLSVVSGFLAAIMYRSRRIAAWQRDCRDSI